MATTTSTTTGEQLIPDDLAGERLDRTLAALFAGTSRSQLARLIEGGFVRLDGAIVHRPALRVEAGQRVGVTFPQAAPARAAAEQLPLHILYQDEDLAIIDKPAGVVVHPAAGHREGTLVNALLFHLEGLSGVGGELRPGIVHRLDKETSGILIVAKNDLAHRALAASWNTPAVRKEYLALVYGTPAVESGTVDAPIGRDPKDRKRMAVVPSGRRAITDYAVVQRFAYCCLMSCSLRTGRTHQIRVHFKQLGHPIVGDATYSGPQWRGVPDRSVQKILSSIHRQALHAWRITFPHPRTGNSMQFEAPLPPDMRDVIVQLREQSRQ